METKICTKCGKEYPATAVFFYRKVKGKETLGCWCKSCDSKSCQKYREANKEAIYHKRKRYREENKEKIKKHLDLTKDKRRVNKIIKQYCVTEDFIQELMNKQLGCCAICEESLVHPLSPASYHIDHNHTTGDVRGLLCVKCNALLGFALENKDILSSAINYLIRNS